VGTNAPKQNREEEENMNERKTGISVGIDPKEREEILKMAGIEIGEKPSGIDSTWFFMTVGNIRSTIEGNRENPDGHNAPLQPILEGVGKVLDHAVEHKDPHLMVTLVGVMACLASRTKHIIPFITHPRMASIPGHTDIIKMFTVDTMMDRAKEIAGEGGEEDGKG
jgi:hypothetical protein